MKSSLPGAPSAVRWIVQTLEEAGYETWAVGGAVRDALAGRPGGDWDLATRARPSTVRSLFRRTVPIGIEHGTVGVLTRDGTLYEVTTFRKDVETDGRHAVVEFADTLEDDLARRDFTINAIAWHPLREEIFDPFDGAEDLQQGVLRTVGEATNRLREDYLRILRALRFAGRFDLVIEVATWRAVQHLVEHLPKLSPERIREELLKVLDDDPTPSLALRLYAESGALRILYPELEALRRENPSAWERCLVVVACLPPGRWVLRLAALLRLLPSAEAAAVLVRLRLSNASTDRVACLADADPMPPPGKPDADVRRWLSRHGAPRLNDLARLELAAARTAGREEAEAVVASWTRARTILRRRPPLAVSDLALDGRDLIRLGMKPGPRFGDILEGLLAWVLEDPDRNEPGLLQEKALEIASRMGETATAGERDG